MRTPTSPTGNADLRRRCRRGFTLVEITVVVIIVAVLAGMTLLPLAGQVGAAELRTSARELLAAARYARHVAVTRRRCCRLSYLPSERRFVLEVEADSPDSAGEYRAVKGATARLAPLPEGVRVERLRIEPFGGEPRERAGTARDGGESSEPRTAITFRPDGQADAALIQLGSGRRRFSLLVFPATGRATLIDGEVSDLPADREDLDA